MKLWHSSWNKIQTGLNRIHAAQNPIHHPRPWADKRIAVRRGQCVRLYSREPQVHGQVAADVNHERTSTVISTVNTNMAENGSTYVSCMSKKRELNATISHHINFNVRCSGVPWRYLYVIWPEAQELVCESAGLSRRASTDWRCALACKVGYWDRPFWRLRGPARSQSTLLRLRSSQGSPSSCCNVSSH